MSFPMFDMPVDEFPHDHIPSENVENMEQFSASQKLKGTKLQKKQFTNVGTLDILALSKALCLIANVHLNIDRNNKPVGEYVECQLDMTNVDSLKTGLTKLISDKVHVPIDQINISMIMHYSRNQKPIPVLRVTDVIHLYTKYVGSEHNIKLGVGWQLSSKDSNVTTQMVSQKDKDKKRIESSNLNKQNNVHNALSVSTERAVDDNKSIDHLLSYSTHDEMPTASEESSLKDRTSVSPLQPNHLMIQVYLEVNHRNRPKGESFLVDLNLTNMDSFKSGLINIIADKMSVSRSSIKISIILVFQCNSKPTIISKYIDVAHLYTSYQHSNKNAQVGVLWTSPEYTQSRPRCSRILGQKSKAVPSFPRLNEQAYKVQRMEDNTMVNIPETSKNAEHTLAVLPSYKETIGGSDCCMGPPSPVHVSHSREQQSKQAENTARLVMADVYLDMNKYAKRRKLKGPFISTQLDMTDMDTVNNGIKELIAKVKDIPIACVDVCEVIVFRSNKKPAPIKNGADVIMLYTRHNSTDDTARLGVIWTSNLSQFVIERERHITTDDYKIQTDTSLLEANQPEHVEHWSSGMSPSWNPAVKLERVQSNNLKYNDYNMPTLNLTSEEIVQSLQSLWEEKRLCDVTLVCEGDIKIKAHRIILASHSAIFLDNNIFEACNGVYNFRDISSETITLALEYLYGKSVTLHGTNIQELHTLACQLDIKPLIAVCYVDGRGNHEESKLKESKVTYRTSEQKELWSTEKTSSHDRSSEQDNEKGEDGETEDEWDNEVDDKDEDYTPEGELEDTINQTSIHGEIQREKAKEKSFTVGKTTISVLHKGNAVSFLCDHCNKVFEYKGLLDKHITEVHADVRRIFKVACSDSKDKLQYEEYQMHNHQRYRCLKCNKVYTTWINMNKHYCIKTGKDQKRFKCTKCHKAYGLTCWKKHKCVHRKGTKQQYTCRQCHNRFKKKNLYDSHKCVVGNNNDPAYSWRAIEERSWRVKLMFTESHICPRCDRQFTVKAEMQKHVKDKHGLCMFYCETRQCDETFMTSDSSVLENHIAKVHQEPWRQCPMCDDFRSVLWMPLNHHMLVEHKKVACLFCDHVIYKGPNRMLCHLKTKHNILVKSKLLQCPHEGCTFTSYLGDTIKVHLTKHSSERPYRCDLCDMAFKVKR